MFRLHAAWGAVIATGILMHPTLAQDVTFHFTAKVASVDDQGGYLGGKVREGDEITGSYTYKVGTPDDNDASTVGDYFHRSGPYGISVTMGGHRFFTNPDNMEFLVELCNNHGEPASDNYLLRSYKNLVEPALANGGGAGHIAWQLDDPGLKALNSADLTTAAPVLKDWQSMFGLTLEGCGQGSMGFCQGGYFVRAHVTSISATPVPGGDAPVAHWPFEGLRAGMVSTDITGHGFDLAATQKAKALGSMEGAQGQALKVLDAGFELEVANSRDAFNFAQGTVEGIVFFVPGKAGGFQTVFSNTTALPGILRGWEFLVESHSGRLVFRMGNHKVSRKWIVTSSRMGMGPRKAYHVAATFTRKEVALYINGEKVAVGAGAVYLPNQQKAFVGHGFTPIVQFYNYFPGALDELKVYDKALDGAAIGKRYKAAQAGIEEMNARNAK